MSFEREVKNMLKMASMIADQMDAVADNFSTVPGDVALRMFADGIRKTNEASLKIPSPIN